jgi:hypothetical protein
LFPQVQEREPRWRGRVRGAQGSVCLRVRPLGRGGTVGSRWHRAFSPARAQGPAAPGPLLRGRPVLRHSSGPRAPRKASYLASGAQHAPQGRRASPRRTGQAALLSCCSWAHAWRLAPALAFHSQLPRLLGCHDYRYVERDSRKASRRRARSVSFVPLSRFLN